MLTTQSKIGVQTGIVTSNCKFYEFLVKFLSAYNACLSRTLTYLIQFGSGAVA